jgi:hypothetical protein
MGHELITESRREEWLAQTAVELRADLTLAPVPLWRVFELVSRWEGDGEVVRCSVACGASLGGRVYLAEILMTLVADPFH